VRKTLLIAGKKSWKSIISKNVKAVVAGGKERYHSVFCGLQELEKQKSSAEYVMIHDGARPFVDHDIIKRCAENVAKYKACVVGMPVKDTIKIADENLFASQTPKRSDVWMIQTPQAFERALIQEAYKNILEREAAGEALFITDDAMVVETTTEFKIKMVSGSYENIKITTPEDFAKLQKYSVK